MSNSYKLQLQLARLQAKLERASVLLRESYSADSLQTKGTEIWSIRASLIGKIWEKSGNTDRFSLLGLQNHCGWWLQKFWKFSACFDWKQVHKSRDRWNSLPRIPNSAFATAPWCFPARKSQLRGQRKWTHRTHKITRGTILTPPRGFPCGSAVKNPPAMQKTWVLSLGREDPLEKEIQSTPVFLPGKPHGQRSLAGYSPWGLQTSWTWLRD